MTENLFSYGRLQREETQLKLFGRILNGVGDILEDYKVTSIKVFDASFLATGDGKTQKTVVPTGICGDFVKGIVYEISEEELALAEAFEPETYRRMKVNLKSGNVAWLFIAL